MSQMAQNAGRNGASSSHGVSSPLTVTSQSVVLSLSGVLDAEERPALEAALAGPGRVNLIVDLSEVRRLSPAIVAVLRWFATGCAAEGRVLRLAACPGESVPALNGVGGLELHPSVAEAITASAGTSAPPAGQGLVGESTDHLHKEVAGLRRSLLTRPLIAQAQGMLRERYRLRDGEVAFDLLRGASQRHNIKLRWLASAVLQAPKPPRGGLWFPGRGHAPTPRISFAASGDTRHLPLPSFLDTVRDSVCVITQTDMANVQLVDPASGALWLESQCGFPQEFVEFFAVVDQGTAACGRAARTARRVLVGDVADDPVYDEPTRRIVLASGSRSLQATPLVGPDGRLKGIFSTHHRRPHRGYSPTELAALDAVASQVGRWLAWHHRTRLLDALEYLHQQAQGLAGQAVTASPLPRTPVPDLPTPSHAD